MDPSTGDASVGIREYYPPKKFEIVHAKSCNLVHFGPETVPNAVHSAFLNTLTMGTEFPRVPPSK